MPENQKNLHRLIAERIRTLGPMPVAEYMELAVTAYYGTQNPFGSAGDFITAPDISQMFGEMIGVWLTDLWLQMGSPPDVRLVELGPGRGTLAVDVMRTLSNRPDFKAAVTLHLVETSPRLRNIQAETLKNCHSPCPTLWHDTFSSVPEGVCLVIANEFFDSLPVQQFKKVHQFEKVQQFEKIGQEWRERCVGYDEEKDAFYFTGDAGDILERSPASLAILEEISGRIATYNGAALIVDYGYTTPTSGDTLQAVSKHLYSSPLENPGEKDITAHVDFGALQAVAGRTTAVSGPVTQAQFLLEMGIEARARKLCEKADDRHRQGIMADLHRLVAPLEMGHLFKVMGLTSKKAIIKPAGFSLSCGRTPPVL